MTDLAAMRAERDRLDRQIRETEAEALAALNFDLDRLSDALYEHAGRNGIPWTDGGRKNWTTLVLAERVTVKFGKWTADSGGGLMVIAGGMTATFDQLPATGMLTGLVDFLLAQEGR